MNNNQDTELLLHAVTLAGARVNGEQQAPLVGDERNDWHVSITYQAVRYRGGFVGLVRSNGRELWHGITPLPEPEALAMAKATAADEAAHYAGDWDVEVSHGTNILLQHTRARAQQHPLAR